MVSFRRIVPMALAVVSIGILGGISALWWQGSKSQHLTLAAGSATGESYILAKAVKNVVERNYSKIRISLVETGGTAENLKMLEAGRADLVTAQADVLAGPSAMSVAVLYDDEFQLLVQKDLPIRSFADLRGRRVALPASGGQFESFLRVAQHFGLERTSFDFIGANDSDADRAFLDGAADASFHVRALGSPAVQHLVQNAKCRFLPVEHAAAMKIEHPAFAPAVIPEGAYLGEPPVPDRDLHTVAVHRMLLAHSAADKAAIRAVTSVLIERRQALMDEIPANKTEVRLLLGQVRRPEAQVGLGPPLHPGALSFYDKDTPSFLQAHADFVGLILTVAIMIGSWIWELKQWMQRQQKNTADQYSDRAVALMNSAQATTSHAELDQLWNALLQVLTEAVHDLDQDKLSEQSFDSFRSILQLAMEATKERRIALASQISRTSAVS